MIVNYRFRSRSKAYADKVEAELKKAGWQTQRRVEQRYHVTDKASLRLEAIEAAAPEQEKLQGKVAAATPYYVVESDAVGV